MKPYNEEQNKKTQVLAMFDNIAPTYDRLNHILSMNIDRLWRRRVVRIVRGFRPKRILDVATGTGDLAIALALKIRDCRILGVDISEQMLRIAADKISERGLDERITLQAGDAEHLELSEGGLDVATVAFGVRNFENIDAGLRELHRVLKTGGHLAILEFSTPDNRFVRAVYERYSHKILPRIGQLISRDRQAYDYLPESVDEFPSPERFTEMLRAAGFRSIETHRQSFGIARIYTAEK
ncbi:MAG: bifunctional demethylmenaquinone methyltransferase/2-methoxy-6-polyprenyl-1,4-benzoquinol methylase UbiE [Alistipes sp.]|nr:bifunctional demethylmenaquinone methyltransferase/2-methoxy-6-polyprenyl-1,4-benzoquinol methylase UbiE [Alistipes sp.]